MNCTELQGSLKENERGSGAEQQAHLKGCSACAALVNDLNLIAATAVELRETEEPSPRVWNSIEIALRQEGLIRPQRSTPTRSLLPSLGARWSWARWLAPTAAAVLITVGIYVHRQANPQGPQVATNYQSHTVSNARADLRLAGLNDDDFEQEIADQTPGQRAQFEDNLRRVNDSIRDAQGDVDANPNDEEAQRSLDEAYQQKAMLFEMAMEPSLP
jgi:hypothetical protein